MAHELDTRLQRHVTQAYYAPEDDDDPLLLLEEELSQSALADDDLDAKTPNWYIRFVERFSYIVIILVILLSVGCGVLVYFYAPLPDFKDPTKGFETRGTPIHNAAYTLKNLWQHKDDQYFITPNASYMCEKLHIPESLRNNPLNPFSKLCLPNRNRRSTGNSHLRLLQGVKGRNLASDLAILSRGAAENGHHAGRHPRDIDGDESDEMCGHYSINWDAKQDNYKFLFEVVDPFPDLLTTDGLRDMCELEREIIIPNMLPQCVIKSLSRMTLHQRGKDPDRCDIDQGDVDFLRYLLATCATYYYNGSLPLTFGHQVVPPPTMPDLCKTNADFVYSTLFYMTPNDFYRNLSDADNVELKIALSFVERRALGDPKMFYTSEIEGRTLGSDKVQITALNVHDQNDLKYDLFRKYLMSDVRKYFSLALGLILLLMLLYSRSFVIVVATTLNVVFSFSLACAIYFFILQMKFFPFINILAGLVLIAVGADDVFIFYDTWQQVREHDPQVTFQRALSRTFSHAALSIFVTSLTTASAFFTNSISTITCIQCFGIFSGVAILVNFLLMITWTPAVIVAMEKVSDLIVKSCQSGSLVSLVKNWYAMIHCLRRFSVAAFDKFLAGVISKTWFVWIPVFLLLGVGGFVVVFVNPKLKLPESQDFQLFPETSLLENWDKNFHDKFPFLVKTKDDQQLPVYFIFGFEALDVGNKLDPDDQGKNLTEDPKFDFYSAESQIYLRDFCVSLKNQSFIQRIYSHQSCAIEEYGHYFEYYCNDSELAPYIHPHGCCTNFHPPYSRKQIDTCLPALLLLLGQNSHTFQGRPIFNSENKISGFMMFVYSQLDFTMSYELMDDNYHILRKFFNAEMREAPLGLRSAFFSARYKLTFYDLQHAIADGTYYSIGLSLIVALVVMLVTSQNVLITLYAIVTITMAISCTVASIVLLGWHLNIVESITISLAVGLSIDFTIHYGMAYRLSKSHMAKERVRESFCRVGSAVAMAALTTFAAGSAMMPSHTVAYTKLGTFLMLVMAFSWLYATFFFQSVCRIIGPRGNFCQIPGLARWRRCCHGNGDITPRSHCESGEDDDHLITF